jgi:hypothetical protein
MTFATSVYVALTTKPSCSIMSEGTRCIHLRAAHAFVRQKLLPRWETNGWEPHDGSFASQKLRN